MTGIYIDRRFAFQLYIGSLIFSEEFETVFIISQLFQPKGTIFVDLSI